MIHSGETYTLHHYLCWRITAQFLSFCALPCGPICTSEIGGAVLAKLRFSFLKLQPPFLFTSFPQFSTFLFSPSAQLYFPPSPLLLQGARVFKPMNFATCPVLSYNVAIDSASWVAALLRTEPLSSAVFRLFGWA